MNILKSPPGLSVARAFLGFWNAISGSRNFVLSKLETSERYLSIAEYESPL